MRIFSKLTGTVAAAALIAVSTAPAAARDGRWDGGRPRHHHDRGPSAGAVVGAIAAFGIIAAIASSSKKKQEERARDYDYDVQPPYSGPQDNGYYDNGAPRPRYEDDGAGYDSRTPAPRYDDTVGRSSQDDAVDACVIAARDAASRGGDYAEIRDVTSVGRQGNGWSVTGEVEQRASYRATDGWSRNFRCSWSDGQVSGVSLD